MIRHCDGEFPIIIEMADGTTSDQLVELADHLRVNPHLQLHTTTWSYDEDKGDVLTACVSTFGIE